MAALFLSGWLTGPVSVRSEDPTGWDAIRHDHSEFYSGLRLLELGGGILAGGVLANTSVDEDFRDWCQEDVRSSGSDDLAKVVKVFGDGFITVPVFAGATAIGMWADPGGWAGTLGTWGQRSLRSVLVGAPPVLALQQVLGSGRPRDGAHSAWEPFDEDNGVSGHAFMGAVPFLVAAQMTERTWLRGLLYAGSTLCGLSRINDDDHYLSQVAIGWWIAALATESVGAVTDGAGRSRLEPFMDCEYGGMAMRWSF